MVWAISDRILREKLKLLPTIISEHNSNKNMIVSFLSDSKIKTHFQRTQVPYGNNRLKIKVHKLGISQSTAYYTFIYQIKIASYG